MSIWNVLDAQGAILGTVNEAAMADAWREARKVYGRTKDDKGLERIRALRVERDGKSAPSGAGGNG